MNKNTTFLNSLMGGVISLSIGLEAIADETGNFQSLFTQSDDGSVMVVAHRGCWKSTAENSLSSIDACLDLGIDMVEIDVARTKDGHLVVMHDKTVDRTTSGSGKVVDLTLGEIQSLRLRSGAGGATASLTNERVPTWRDVLSHAKGKILINLDAKGDVRDQAVAEAIELGVEDQIVSKIGVKTPDDPALRNATFWKHGYFMPILRECTPHRISNDLDCAPSLSAATEMYQPYNPIAFEVTYTSEDYLREGLPVMLAKGRVWINTLSPNHAAGIVDSKAVLDPEATWGHLLDMGVNMIQTDEPEALLMYLRQRGLHESHGTVAKRDDKH